MLKKSYYVVIFLTLVLLPILAFAASLPEEITITTYYPSPVGSYKDLQLYPYANSDDPVSGTPTSCVPGTMYYSNTHNQLRICNNSNVWGNAIGGAGDFWKPSPITANTNAIYYSAGNVGIGTSDPKAMLDVAGGVKISDDTTCNTAKGGTIRYNNNKLQYCNGALTPPNWIDTGAPVSEGLYGACVSREWTGKDCNSVGAIISFPPTITRASSPASCSITSSSDPGLCTCPSEYTMILVGDYIFPPTNLGGSTVYYFYACYKR